MNHCAKSYNQPVVGARPEVIPHRDRSQAGPCQSTVHAENGEGETRSYSRFGDNLTPVVHTGRRPPPSGEAGSGPFLSHKDLTA